MDRVRFEQRLLEVGFIKVVRPERHMGKGFTKPPYWFELPKERASKCGEYQSMTCAQTKTIRLLPDGRQITCAGCRSTWIHHLKD